MAVLILIVCLLSIYTVSLDAGTADDPNGRCSAFYCPVEYEAGVCPEGFFKMADSPLCLAHVHEPLMTWEAASEHCESIGAELASGLSDQEMRDLIGFLSVPPYMKAGKKRRISMFWSHWLSATNTLSDSGKWLWYAGGYEIPIDCNATFWDYGQPEGSNTCLIFTAGRFGYYSGWNQWKTYNCYKKRPFVCQIRLNELDPFNCQGS